MVIMEESYVQDGTHILLVDESDGLGTLLHIIAYPKAIQSFEGIKAGDCFRVELSSKMDTKTTKSIYQMLHRNEIELKDIAMWLNNDRIARYCLGLN